MQTAIRPVSQQQRGPAQQMADPELLQAVSDSPSIEELTPVESGPGLVVCEPIAAKTAATQAEFGDGFSRWLQYVVGAQGAQGRTPLWTSIDDARRSRGRSIEIGALWPKPKVHRRGQNQTRSNPEESHVRY